jgi:hypothetical protein
MSSALERAFLMRERVVEVAASPFDDAEIGFGERALDLVAAVAGDLAEFQGKNLTARVVALRQRDLDALSERIRQIVGIVVSFRELGDALPFAIGGRQRADRREHVAGGPGRPLVAGQAADTVHQRSGRRRLEHVGDRLGDVKRGGGRRGARILAIVVGTRGGARHRCNDEHNDGCARRLHTLIKPVFRSLASLNHESPRRIHVHAVGDGTYDARFRFCAPQRLVRARTVHKR